MVKRKRAKVDKQKIFWVCAAIVALVCVIVAIVNINQVEPIDDDYFTDSDTKIVATMDADTAGYDDTDWEPPITRIVYYVDGEGKIENMRIFYEYEDEETAREAIKNVDGSRFAVGKKLNGRYIIFQAKDSQYKGLTADELKRNLESMRDAEAIW